MLVLTNQDQPGGGGGGGGGGVNTASVTQKCREKVRFVFLHF